MAGEVTELSHAAIRAEIDQVTAKGHGQAAGEPRVLGLRGKPDPTLASTFTHVVARERVTVNVVPCISALSAREALVDHEAGDWLVLVTDRDESDLGAGIVGHLIGQRLRQIDPWLGVKDAFGATGIDRSLSRLPQDRLVAQGLLSVLRERSDSWPAAPGALLTLDHVGGALARRVLGFPQRTLDGVAVLRWAASGAQALGALANLRQRGGDPLAETLLDWLASRCGAAGGVVRSELREARPARIVPLGVAAHHLWEARVSDPAASTAWGRFIEVHGSAYAKPGVAEALGTMSITVIEDLLGPGPDGHAVRWAWGAGLLTEADKLLGEVGASAVVAASMILPTGLKQRFRNLAAALAAEADSGSVDATWQAVRSHNLVQLAPARQRHAAFAPSEAAVRLHRWLASTRSFITTQPSGEASTPSFAAMCRQHVHEEAWVDSAIHDAAGGASDVELSTALAAVVGEARVQRAAGDRTFAVELARITEIGDGQAGALSGSGDPVIPLEHVLREVIAPLATTTPALLIVLDGMTARVAAEIVEDTLAEGRGWVEALPSGVHARLAGLAVLPTLTEHSRTSLLCCRLVSGTQQTEKKEHPAAARSLGIGVTRIFHKAELDQVPDGHRIAHSVRDALGDSSVRLVTCVLNTIDDALDRSDPEGTDWRLDSVKHLSALLEEAADVGRAVVLTSDHGHVLERRQGAKQPAAATSARSREVSDGVREGEVLVRGPRVLGPSPIVLAVDDTVRYNDLRAGYHGGGTPAEAVVPIVVLWPGSVPDKLGDALAGEAERPFPYVEASSQRPVWWDHPVVGLGAGEVMRPQSPPVSKLSQPEPVAAEKKTKPQAKADPGQDSLTGPGHTIISRPVWKAQRAIAGRVALTDDQCADLIDALAAAPGTRLALSAVARVLGIPDARTLGAISQLQKLLNVEGYAVVRQDQGVLVLDPGLLAEQFGVTSQG